LLEYKALVPAQRDHFDGQRFFNPTGPALQPLTAVPRMLFTPRAKWPRYVPEVPRQPPPRNTARPAATFIEAVESFATGCQQLAKNAAAL
jgi:hypothetical protein